MPYLGVGCTEPHHQLPENSGVFMPKSITPLRLDDSLECLPGTCYTYDYSGFTAIEGYKSEPNKRRNAWGKIQSGPKHDSPWGVRTRHCLAQGCVLPTRKVT